MEERLLEFIAGLRAAGVRISVAESGDSFRAVEEIGVQDRDLFRAALCTTLVKEPTDIEAFNRLFPLYFGREAPPMMPANQGMTPEQQQQLRQALESLPQELADMLRRLMEGQKLDPQQMADMRAQLQQQGQSQDGQQQQGQMSEQQLQELMDQLAQALRSRLAQLLNWLMSGQSPSQQELQQIGQEVGLQRASHPYQQQGLTDRMLQAMGMEQLADLLQEIFEQLAQAGMGQEALQQMAETLQSNAEALGEQVSQFVGSSIAKQVADQNPPPARTSDLMQRQFGSLSEQEAAQLRTEVRRLAAQLRSRASLRHRRGKTGLLDPKATIRANQHYGGVPVELHYRHRHLKPKLVLICDISTSMRPVVQFLLQLVYELQDQVARARSFAFIDDIQEITFNFSELRPEAAIQRVLDNMPPGYYNTDLGFALTHFTKDFMDAVDSRTTVIVVGDGRNNYNPPRLDAFESIRQRAKRMLWFNPEPPMTWGVGDSDMPKYLPLCHAVHEVGNMSQLTDAVDRLFMD
jgi:uncharacterized protein with von Willebrand factor type A (vWA) domain